MKTNLELDPSPVNGEHPEENVYTYENEPVPFFKSSPVDIQDYQAVDLTQNPSLVLLFNDVIGYLSQDNELLYSAVYTPLINKAKNSFLLSISNNGNIDNVFIKTESSMSETEIEFANQYRDIIEKSECIGDVTYGKKTRQYFALTKDGKPYTFGIASIKN